jgi:hypothetical protein
MHQMQHVNCRMAVGTPARMLSLHLLPSPECTACNASTLRRWCILAYDHSTCFCVTKASDLPAWRMHICSLPHGNTGMITSMLRQSLPWPLPCWVNLKRCIPTRCCSTRPYIMSHHKDVLDTLEDPYSPNWLLQRPCPKVTAWRLCVLHATLFTSNLRQDSFIVHTAGHPNLIACSKAGELLCHQG